MGVFALGLHLPGWGETRRWGFLWQVNQKLEQCAEACIAKLLKALALRNQDRSARILED